VRLGRPPPRGGYGVCRPPRVTRARHQRPAPRRVAVCRPRTAYRRLPPAVAGPAAAVPNRLAPDSSPRPAPVPGRGVAPLAATRRRSAAPLPPPAVCSRRPRRPTPWSPHRRRRLPHRRRPLPLDPSPSFGHMRNRQSSRQGMARARGSCLRQKIRHPTVGEVSGKNATPRRKHLSFNPTG